MKQYVLYRQGTKVVVARVVAKDGEDLCRWLNTSAIGRSMKPSEGFDAEESEAQ